MILSKNILLKNNNNSIDTLTTKNKNKIVSTFTRLNLPFVGPGLKKFTVEAILDNWQFDTQKKKGIFNWLKITRLLINIKYNFFFLSNPSQVGLSQAEPIAGLT